MEKSRETKISGNGKFPVNGKIPRDEKPRGFLVMGEPNCLTLKNPCFVKELYSTPLLFPLGDSKDKDVLTLGNFDPAFFLVYNIIPSHA